MSGFMKGILIVAAVIVLVCLALLATVFIGPNLAAWAVSALILVAAIGFVWWFIVSKPDDDVGDKPMTLGTRRFLILYLAAVCMLLIAGIAFLFSFNYIHDAQFNPIPLTATTFPKPAQVGYLDTGWNQRWFLSLDIQLLLLGICAGALGSSIHALKSLADFLGNCTAKTSWLWFYLTRPFLGAALALIIYAMIRGGLLTGAQGAGAAVDPFGVLAVCGLAGMFADRASQKLSEVFDTLFTTDDKRKDKLFAHKDKFADLRLDPPTVPVKAPLRVVRVRGTGVEGAEKVRINGDERAPIPLSDTAIAFELTEAEITAKGRLKIQLVTADGDFSKELILNVSDIAITTLALPGGTVGQAYGPVPLEAKEGVGPYKWNGQGLPGGLTLSKDTGQLAGTPAVAGLRLVEITVTDRDGATAKTSLPLRIA
jgi:hypothetical protein